MKRNKKMDDAMDLLRKVRGTVNDGERLPSIPPSKPFTGTLKDKRDNPKHRENYDE
jgi:hypothetical protein